MFKAFGKVFLVSLIVVALMSPLAFATTARVNSLARSGDYLNDDSNVFRWYGTLASYSNLVMAELGTYDMYNAYHQALGVTHACAEDGKYGTWGVFLLHNITDNNFFGVVNPLPTPWLEDETIPPPWYNDVEVPDNKFALSWGKEFEEFAVGLSFTRSDIGWEDNRYDPVEEGSISFTTVGAGLRADLGENAYADFAATLGLAGGGWTDSTEFDKKNAFDIAGRVFWEWKDYATLVPLIEFVMYEYALDGQDIPHGDKGTAFRLGLAMNLDVNSNNLLIFGLEFMHEKLEYSYPDTVDTSTKDWKALTLPLIRLALESDVKPWLTVRVGALKDLWKGTASNVEGKEWFETYSWFEWFLGCGFHVAEFDIDCELGPELPFSLGYWLTGHTAYPRYPYGIGTDAEAQENGYGYGPVTRISATYHF